MTTIGSKSWASVVANGLPDKPTPKIDNKECANERKLPAKPMPAKKLVFTKSNMKPVKLLTKGPSTSVTAPAAVQQAKTQAKAKAKAKAKARAKAQSHVKARPQAQAQVQIQAQPHASTQFQSMPPIDKDTGKPINSVTVLSQEPQAQALPQPQPQSQPKPKGAKGIRGAFTKKHMQAHTDTRGSSSGNWQPRQRIIFSSDHRSYHGANTQWNLYSPQRYQHRLVPIAGSYVTPMNWQPHGSPSVMNRVMVSSKKMPVPSYYPQMRMIVPIAVDQMPAKPAEMMYQEQHHRHQQQKPMKDKRNYTNSNGRKNMWYNKDGNQPKEAGGDAILKCWPASPRPSRCDLMNWESIGNSRQVWEPLNINQHFLDPSNSLQVLLPGFEHIRNGKRLLSSRARKIMGDHSNVAQGTEYATPEPMEIPDRELREQQHFIGNHDTHLTSGLPQLKVTNGATGDGYYVRPVVKLLPQVVKGMESPTPKYKSLYNPNVTYWDLLRRNREQTELDAKKKAENVAAVDEDELILKNIEAEFNMQAKLLDF